MERSRRWRTAARRGPRSVAAVAVGVLALAGVGVVAPAPAGALENGVARTPPMGWNDWNSFGCNVSETLVKAMADTIVSRGLAALGYTYVVIDDCWFDPTRDSAGNLQPNASRFPSGMKAMGDYLHGKGLKFGIYQVPNARTCAQGVGTYSGSTGSLGHEQQDAQQFAAWGVDYLKYDWCSGTGTIDDQVASFAKMRDALAATGRPIVFSINPNSFHAPTGPQRNWGDVANLWRTTEDITTSWDTGNTNSYPMGIRNIVDINVPLAGYAAPGRFNDPDMLEVGNGGLTDTEARSHFALWAMMAAPLMMGNDLRTASAATLEILGNTTLIAIDQDPLGLQATQLSNDGTRRILVKRLSNGDVAVALFNQGSSSTTISTTASAVGLSGSSFSLREAWTGAVTTTSGAISATVPAHGTVVYRVSASGGSTATTSTTTTSTTTSAPATGATTLVGAQSGKCLDAGGTTAGSTVRIATCSGSTQQSWRFTAAGELRTLNDTMCLDADNSGTSPGTALLIWTCHGGANQQFSTGSNGSIVGGQSGLCVDVNEASTADGAAVILWTCHGASNQRWTAGTTSTTTTTRPVTTTTTTTRPATTTTTTVGTTAGSGACAASLATTSSWPGGFVADVTVTATQPLTGWRVTLALPDGVSVANAWNATVTGSTGAVTATNAGYNGTLAAGASTSFGFQATGSSGGITLSCAAS